MVDLGREAEPVEHLGDLDRHHHATVPATRAPDAYREVRLALADVGRQEQPEHPLDLDEELLGLGLLEHVATDARVCAGTGPQALHPMGVREEPAVEHDVDVERDAVLVPERHDVRLQRRRHALCPAEALAQSIAQLVHIEVRRVDHEIRLALELLQQRALLCDAVCDAIRRRQGMRTPRGLEAPNQRLVRRVEALQAFLKTDDGANLLIGYRRAANILKIEEKKDKREYRGIPDGLKQDEEVALQRGLTHAKVDMAKALSSEDFADALRALASLRVPVDRFFERVTVNTDDKTLRENRLMLLSQIVETAHQIADFSKVEG